MSSTTEIYNTRFLFFIAMISALGGLLFGYDLLVISGAKQFYELTYHLTTPAIQGWAVSSCIVGCILGALIVGPLSERFGRVRLLILSALLFLISAIGSGYAPTFTQFVIYRILGGIGMGMASTLSPMYIAEIAPAKLRGRLVSLNQLTIVVGILLAQLINYLIVEYKPVPEIIQNQSKLSADLALSAPKHLSGTTYSSEMFTQGQLEGITSGDLLKDIPVEAIDATRLESLLASGSAIPTDVIDLEKLSNHTDASLNATWNGQTGWRLMFAAEAIPALTFFLLMFFVPESPRWQIKNNMKEAAEKTLTKIGGTKYASLASAEVSSTLTPDDAKSSFSDIFKPSVFGIVLMGIIIAVYQQWCGINVIFNYAPDIFRDAGFTVSGIMFSLVIIGFTNMAFTFLGMALIDRLGRKPLMLIGSAGLAFSYIAVGLCYYIGATGWYVVAFALLAIAFFATTLGPVAWCFISEIFPNSVRGIAMATAVLSLWLANFILTYTFPTLLATLGASYTFWLYASINVIAFIYIKSKVPETKNKTLEEIEKEFSE